MKVAEAVDHMTALYLRRIIDPPLLDSDSGAEHS